MIVSIENFSSIVEKLSRPDQYGADSETTGLTEEDELFSIIMSDESGGYYFNFNHRPDHLGNYSPQEVTLPIEWLALMRPIFENPESLFFLHNAKFDMRMLDKAGLTILGQVHDTEVTERVLHNNKIGHKPYSLKSTAHSYGYTKSDAVDEYIAKHKLFVKFPIPGKDRQGEKKFFHKVPFGVIAPYGETDAIITRAIGLAQIAKIKQLDYETAPGNALASNLILNERKLTKTCFRMERNGMMINRPYVERASDYIKTRAVRAEAEFKQMTGVEFEDSPILLQSVFQSVGVQLPKTATGRVSSAKGVLDELNHPIADKVREIRGIKKLGSTYYSSFLHFADKYDIIHPNMRQGGTETMRFSYSDPNLQNLPKEDEDEDRTKEFLVRRSFIPYPNWTLVTIDYSQQEYSLMAAYAGERQLIDAIMAGEDVHAATARLMGVTRKQAKTLNFGLLYGMGIPKLAGALGISIEEATLLRAKYFAALPAVRQFTREVMSRGEKRGYVYNWMGHRLHVSSPEFAYVLPNHLIQSSGAQTCRKAMVSVEEYLINKRCRSQMNLQVHDELVFNIHPGELDIIPDIKLIMENAFPTMNGLSLKCSVETSQKSLAKWDLEKYAC